VALLPNRIVIVLMLSCGDDLFRWVKTPLEGIGSGGSGELAR